MKPILEISDVGKMYRIAHLSAGYLSLRERLMNPIRRNVSEEFWALRDVSFSVQRGESVGIIGRNGAGKSTLLKILSKITPPSKGRIVSRGRIASLLEVGTGFHPELTGRENIFFNGSLLGMKRKEIEKKFDDIVDFSGVEKFLDTPLKHYSSGMQLRLAFAVAAFLEPEILIIDEVLAVGDAEFQKKCLGKMEDVSKSGRTILFVSHDLNAVSKLCTKTLFIKNGTIAGEGDTVDVIRQYHRDIKSSNASFKRERNETSKPVYFKSISVRDNKGNDCTEFLYLDPIVIEFEIGINDAKVNCDLFVLVLNAFKKRVFALESRDINTTMRLTIDPGQLVRGSYSIYTFLNQPHVARLDEVEDVCHFEVIDNGSAMLKHGGYDYGDVFGKGTWQFK